MEIILAIVVATAVIFFGALISMGNERQRRAIDGLREQLALWAVQDLKIKREKIASTITVGNPMEWINQIATRISGIHFDLQTVEVYENPHTLVCISRDSTHKIAFTPISVRELQKKLPNKQNRITNFSNPNPLTNQSQTLKTFEVSVLNAGFLFDLELPVAWKALTGNDINQIEKIWMYII